MGDSDYERIRERIEQRFNARKEFLIHLAVFIPVNLTFWLVWLSWMRDVSPFLGLPWPLFMTLGWGAGLLAHGLDVYFKSGAMDARRERAIRREIEWERLLRGGSFEESADHRPKRGAPDTDTEDEAERKAKRGSVRLSDDGELLYEDEPLRARSRKDR